MKPESFEEAVRLYEPMLRGQLQKLLLYRDLEEYYQHALVAFWKAYERFDVKKGHFGAYAKQTVRGYLLVQLQREKRQEERFVPVDDEVTSVLPAPEEAEWPIVLEALTDLQRRVVIGRFLEQKLIKELAAELGMTVEQVKYVSRAALKVLRRHAEELRK